MDLGVDQLIVTQLVPYGDSDIVVRFFSRDRGRGAAFARGARRSKKRFAGSLQVLARGRARMRDRRGADMPALESFEADADLFALASDPDRLGRASYLVEVTERLLPEAEPAPEIYEALCDALTLVGAGRGDARLLRAYELKLLGWTGYLPDLADEGDWLDGPSGELVVEQPPGGVPFGAGTRALAVELFTRRLQDPPVAADDDVRVVGRLFASHLRRMGIRELKSVSFLRSLA